MSHSIARALPVIVALTVTMLVPLGATAGATPDARPGRLTINDGRPVSRSHDGDLYGYATCPDGRAPGALATAALDLPGDWYSTSPYGGYWAKLTVSDAGTPGRHIARVDCRRDGSPSTEFTIVG